MARPRSDLDGVDLDAAFDRELPRRIQVKSAIHFTPVHIAQAAARLLAPWDGMRVLDVGAGPGKFCIAAARAVPGATFVGVEHRAHLVHLGRKLAARLGVANVELIAGDALALDWSRYDAFYLYNPFGEHVHDTARIDATIERSPATFASSVDRVRDQLATTQSGTRVVTYHGFGGDPPGGFELAQRQPIGSDTLQLWIKR